MTAADKLRMKDVAPMLWKAVEQRNDESMRGISRCWQNAGFHVYGAGPCFGTLEQAVAYRQRFDTDMGRA